MFTVDGSKIICVRIELDMSSPNEDIHQRMMMQRRESVNKVKRNEKVTIFRPDLLLSRFVGSLYEEKKNPFFYYYYFFLSFLYISVVEDENK